MNPNNKMHDWTRVCELEDIVPQTGVCALIEGEQVAVFRVHDDLYAIDNIDPHTDAAVLSRGLIGSVDERVVVASPLLKQHFDLRTGECLESPEHAVRTWQVARDGSGVNVRRGAA